MDNREQFYVSISRGRERVQVFTDDADLLARRVTDSHERQAAAELVALRQELARLGSIGDEQLKEKITTPASASRQDFRTVRRMRPVAVRQHRTTRLSPVQRLAEDQRRGFHTGQLIDYRPEPNSSEEKDAPPDKLTLAFATAAWWFWVGSSPASPSTFAMATCSPSAPCPAATLASTASKPSSPPSPSPRLPKSETITSPAAGFLHAFWTLDAWICDYFGRTG